MIGGNRRSRSRGRGRRGGGERGSFFIVEKIVIILVVYYIKGNELMITLTRKKGVFTGKYKRKDTV